MILVRKSKNVPGGQITTTGRYQQENGNCGLLVIIVVFPGNNRFERDTSMEGAVSWLLFPLV